MAIVEHVHRFTTAEYSRLVEADALAELRVELLDGVLVDMSPQSEEHVRRVRALMILFGSRLDLLHVQMPMDTEDGWVPEPDLALAYRPDGRHPTTARLVVEIAVTSSALDLRKAATYARAGVDRYWLVDVARRCVLEHTGPTPSGYDVVTIREGEDRLDAGVEGVPATTAAAILG